MDHWKELIEKIDVEVTKGVISANNFRSMAIGPKGIDHETVDVVKDLAHKAINEAAEYMHDIVEIIEKEQR